MNNVSIIGRLTKDIELRMSNNGKENVGVIIAVNRNFKNAQGEYEADFISCKAFGQTAKFMSNYLKKGALVGITGRIQTSRYQNPEGLMIYTTDVIIGQINPLEAKAKEENNPMDFMTKQIQDNELPF